MSSGEERNQPTLAVTITAFPVPGGVRSVLSEVHRALHDDYDVHYLTARIGTDHGEYRIHQFGNRLANPYAFPDAIVYTAAGLWGLWRHHRKHRYSVLLAQDGLYTGLFTALVGKLTGTRVIIMDHGTAVLAMSSDFRAVKLRQAMNRFDESGLLARLHRVSAPLRRRLHMALLPLVLRATTSLSSEYLLVGEEVVDVYRRLGVPPSQIQRYTYTVDADRFRPASDADREQIRRELGLPVDAIVVTMVNRLAPEKGLETAIPAIACVMKQTNRRCVLAIGGSGPMGTDVRRMTTSHGINDSTKMMGDLNADQVARLLSISDIFLYAGSQGTNISAAVLEAMASGCATIATPAPISNEFLLSNGRGVIVPVGNVESIRRAVDYLIVNDCARLNIGTSAREYVQSRHSLANLRQMLKHV